MRLIISKLSSVLFLIIMLVASGCAEDKVHKDENAARPLTSGVNHIGLTVKDLDASASFFVDTLGWRLAGERDYPAKFVTDGSIFVTLWQASNPDTAIDFNRKTNIGLHHLALTVPDIETLEALHETFKSDPKVRIEFGPELNGAGPTVHMMVYEPSGSRIEFAVPGGRRRGD